MREDKTPKTNQDYGDAGNAKKSHSRMGFGGEISLTRSTEMKWVEKILTFLKNSLQLCWLSINKWMKYLAEGNSNHLIIITTASGKTTIVVKVYGENDDWKTDAHAHD